LEKKRCTQGPSKPVEKIGKGRGKKEELLSTEVRVKKNSPAKLENGRK